MHFNIRVYGLLIENNKVLLSEELIRGNWLTKFPGGGLEFGEGTCQCLEREFLEELNLKIVCKEHFYTTDFYIRSAFDESQVLSVYYFIEREQGTVRELIALDAEQQRLSWVPVETLSEDLVHMIGDKKVVELLKNRIIR